MVSRPFWATSPGRYICSSIRLVDKDALAMPPMETEVQILYGGFAPVGVLEFFHVT